MIVHDRTRLTVPLIFFNRNNKMRTCFPDKFIRILIRIAGAAVACTAFFMCARTTVLAQGPSPAEIRSSMLELGLTGVQPLPAPDLQEAAGCVRATQTDVRTETLHGRGSIIGLTDREIRILTAAHVTAGAEQGRITFPVGETGGYECTCRVERTDEASDTAVLTVAAGDVPDIVFLGLRAVTPDADPPAEEEIFCIFDGGVSAGTRAEEKAADGFFTCLLDAVPGMSGAGIFNARGGFAGILIGGETGTERVLAAGWK